MTSLTSCQSPSEDKLFKCFFALDPRSFVAGTSQGGGRRRLRRRLQDEMETKSLAFLSLGVFLFFFLGWGFWKSLGGVFLFYVVTGGWRFLRVIFKTTKRDFGGLLYLMDVGPKMREYQRNRDNVVTLFQQTVKRHPDRVAMVMIDERKWTFQEVDEYSNAVGNYFYELGYRKGDVAAVFMENRPEFVFLWLGLAKIGVVSALINFNLRLETLAHCISISKAKAIIFGAELMEAIKDIRGHLPPSTRLFCRGEFQLDGLQVVRIDEAVEKASKLPPPKDSTTLFNEKLFYVYTSGTTGLPKAAIVIHSRFFYMSNSVYHFFQMRPDDVIYDTLPLYHTAGGVLGIGNCLLKGCTIVMRKKFSATRFWDDCKQNDCTVAQYIGEICRYLLAQPQKSVDGEHKVRVAFGNGLRPQIWNEFKTRFNIERIGEFYGATEGNANIINSDNTPGAIGFQTRLLPFVYPVTLLRVNEETGDLIRNQKGLCMRCEPGEPGELVGKIVKGEPLREFDGYADPEATKKKLAYDVFKKGDCYFLTGDILEMDEYGYMYFRDRTGDTFRWRGENVSTTEVEAVVSNVVQLSDAVVYGVEIPGTEGRAGMAAIVDESKTLDLKKFNYDLKKSLPAYARPVFIRILEKLDMTGTFKLKKNDYKKEGFNPAVVKDSMYFLDPKSGEYELITDGIYKDICSGRIRF